MAKSHLKRVSVPKTWNLHRKTSKFIVRPAGYLESAMPVAVILKEILMLAKTRAEARKIVNGGKVSVDGRVVKSDRLPVGLMSIISIDGKDFRMLLNTRGKLFLKKIDKEESTLKLCKIVSKTTLKGKKLQIGFHDGRTALTENKDCKINDTFAFKLPDFRVNSCMKLAKSAKVYLTGGSNVGRKGVVESIADLIIVKIGDQLVEASKDNVFVIGNETELISITD